MDDWAAPAGAHSGSTEEAGDGIHILAIDDDPTTLHLIGEILRQAGFRVALGASGGEALELVAEVPDLILLDQYLPDLDGLEICARLKADPATTDIPVIFLTADRNPDLEARSLAAGAVDFVTKPFSDRVLLARIRAHLALSRRTRTLERLAHTDPLTGLANRRFFDQSLVREWSRTRRSHTPLSVVLMDVDHFKAVNDRFGHQAGDQCLRTLPRIIRPHLKRPFDLVARLGGEEFALLLPETSAEGAFRLAERIRRDVEATFVRLERERGSGPLLTCSFGCATVVPDGETTASDLLRDADERLYRAKAQGRYRVEPQPAAGAGTPA